MYLHLKRFLDNGNQTTGILKLCDSNGNTILIFDTLELPYRNNQRSISCIPSGTYVVKRKTSIRHGQCLSIEAVPGRSNVLIHKGNFNSDTKGCILIGNGFKDINFDEDLDLLNSRLAMKNLLNTLRTTTTIHIEWL